MIAENRKVTVEEAKCDGAPLLHKVIKRNKRWRNIPMFGCDPPYYMDGV
jgi:hypothetical protein